MRSLWALRPRTMKTSPTQQLAVWYLLASQSSVELPSLLTLPEALARVYYGNWETQTSSTRDGVVVCIFAYCVGISSHHPDCNFSHPHILNIDTLIRSSVLTYYLVSVRSYIPSVYFNKCLRQQHQWSVTTTPVSKCSLENLKSRKCRFSTASCCLFGLSAELFLKIMPLNTY